METADFAIWATIPWTEDTWIDVGFTDYADDLARKVLFDSSAELHRSLRVLDRTLDAQLEIEGYLHNHSKKEVVPHVVGKGRQDKEHAIFGHSH
eukprot:3767064-Heterocapsa_arctica.AAC.1